MKPLTSDPLSFRIGGTIRERRKGARLTLTQVAQRAEISVSHLSNIENGLSMASLPLLAKVASALNIGLAELTRDEDRLAVQPSSLPSPEAGWRELSHHALETRIMAGSFTADDRLEFPLPLRGQDSFIAILKGSVTVAVDGAEYPLQQGDAIDARCALSMTISVAAAATVVCSTTPSFR